MHALSSLARSRLWLGFGALALAAAGAFFFWRDDRSDSLVTTPLLAIEAASGRALYFNGAAYPWLKARRPELLGGDPRAFAQAARNPTLFRQLDRERRFDALLLVGSAGEYRALLDHLLETKDFTPTYVDHWAIFFQRGAERAWRAEDFAPVRARLAALSGRERAQCLAELGAKLVALRRMEEARAFLDESQRLDAASPQAWNGMALLHMQRGEWKEAMACADRALGGRLEPLSAVATKTQVLYATKRFSEAYDLSCKLVEQLPDDPAILFKHAEICHQAHAYRAEIRALEKLISRAQDEQQPTSGYRIYLGQAYAGAGDAERSVAAFTKALADPELPEDQKEFARDNVARIKSRTEP